jgi:N-acetyl-1-D-myo-inositol-2-amino-2-deoxy-alpha-D-glucopyranoside deacetylase
MGKADRYLAAGLLMKSSYQGYRLLLVHAHPDDETINNGATMAMYAALGADITLVTCTRGEEGEVLVEEHSHKAATHDDLLG